MQSPHFLLSVIPCTNSFLCQFALKATPLSSTPHCASPYHGTLSSLLSCLGGLVSNARWKYSFEGNVTFLIYAGPQAPRRQPRFELKFHFINRYRAIVKALARLKVNKQASFFNWILTTKDLIPLRSSPFLHRKQQIVVFLGHSQKFRPLCNQPQQLTRAGKTVVCCDTNAKADAATSQTAQQKPVFPAQNHNLASTKSNREQPLPYNSTKEVSYA